MYVVGDADRTLLQLCITKSGGLAMPRRELLLSHACFVRLTAFGQRTPFIVRK
jgi:hypothetical protein